MANTNKQTPRIQPVLLELSFDEILNENRPLPAYTGGNENYSLNSWLDEANKLLNLTPSGDQKTNVFRLILHTSQGFKFAKKRQL